MKEDFEAEERTLSTLDAGLRTLTADLESAAVEAETAAAASIDGGASSDAARAAGADAAAPRRAENPYAEYRAAATQATHGARPPIDRCLTAF